MTPSLLAAQSPLYATGSDVLRFVLSESGLRIVLGVEYDGSAFCGWQSQPQACGVQDAIDQALSGVAGEPVVSVCAGRTDAGVHALAQVAHFDTAPSARSAHGRGGRMHCCPRAWL